MERHTRVIEAVPLLQAYIRSSEQLKRHIEKLIDILADPKTGQEDHFLTALTLADILDAP